MISFPPLPPFVEIFSAGGVKGLTEGGTNSGGGAEGLAFWGGGVGICASLKGVGIIIGFEG